jgi:hypothetical protein
MSRHALERKKYHCGGDSWQGGLFMKQLKKWVKPVFLLGCYYGMYFTRNWEFDSALLKLRNFGWGVEPPTPRYAIGLLHSGGHRRAGRTQPWWVDLWQTAWQVLGVRNWKERDPETEKNGEKVLKKPSPTKGCWTDGVHDRTRYIFCTEQCSLEHSLTPCFLLCTWNECTIGSCNRAVIW